MSTVPALKIVLREVLSDFQSDNVIYLELRTTPRTLEGGKISKRGYVNACIEVMSEWESSGNKLIPRLIISVDRSKDVREAR